MNTKKLTKELTKTRQAVWSYLMNNIDHEHWATLKRMHNRLSDDLEKLKQMKIQIEEMDSMRLHHVEAIKILRKLKKARAGRKFRLVKIDLRTWKEIEVNH